MSQREFSLPAENTSKAVGLHVVDLRKSFAAPNGDRIEVLRSVTLEVKPGESLAITGASGSGKSTLLHLLGSLDNPDHGSIRLAGAELSRLGTREVAEFRQRQIGFVFQFHYLLADLTAVENVALPLLIARQEYTQAIAESHRLLMEMGLGARANHPVSHLSGGEQQRIAVARALITRPTLLLADEPTGNLDARISEDIGKTLVEYSRKGPKMLLIATHNENVARLCDRVLVLRDGYVHSSLIEAVHSEKE